MFQPCFLLTGVSYFLYYHLPLNCRQCCRYESLPPLHFRSYPLQLKFPESNEKQKRKYVKSNVVFVEKRENNCLTEEDTKGRKLFFLFHFLFKEIKLDNTSIGFGVSIRKFEKLRVD